jgi:hypothetical protein
MVSNGINSFLQLKSSEGLKMSMYFSVLLGGVNHCLPHVFYVMSFVICSIREKGHYAVDCVDLLSFVSVPLKCTQIYSYFRDNVAIGFLVGGSTPATGQERKGLICLGQ